MDFSFIDKIFFLFCADPSLLIVNIVAEPAFVVLIMISRYPSTPLSRNFEKNKGLLLTGPRNYIAQLEPHSRGLEVGGGESEGESE